MGHNTKVLKSTPDPKKPNKPKDIVVGNSSTEDWLNEFDTDEERSREGYKDTSRFRNEPYNDIYTPTGMIDMSETGIPLMANGQYLPPYSGITNMGTPYVREVPFGGQNTKTHTHMANGGWLDTYDEGGSKIKNKLSKNILAKGERSNQDNTKVSNLPIKTLQALQQQADVEKTARQQYKQQPVISQGRKLNPTKQAYSDKVQARIANPSNDLGITAANMASALTRFRYLNPEEIAATTNNPSATVGLSSNIMTEALANEMAGPAFGKAFSSGAKTIKKVPKELPGSPNAPKGNMYGENQVLTQQSRLLDPEIKAKFFEHQAPEIEAKIQSNILGEKLWKAPKDYGNRITPENYEEFVKKIHGSTNYDLAANSWKKPENLGIGNYGKPGTVYSDAPLNNLGKDIINAHEKNHGIFAGTMSTEMGKDLLKPFGTNKPVPFYQSKHQPDEVLARMAQFKNAIGMSDNQPFTLGHLNLIRKNYANSFLDNGITEMLNKIKPGSSGEKHFLNNMNKYAFGVGAPAAIGASALQEEEDGGWLDTMQEGGSRTDIYTDKALFDKAYKAEMDSSRAHNLTLHDPQYDELNELKMLFEDPRYNVGMNSKPFTTHSTEDLKQKVYTSKKKPSVTEDNKNIFNDYLKHTRLKPEYYKVIEKDRWLINNKIPTNLEQTIVIPEKTKFIEDELNRALIKKNFPKATDAFIDKKVKEQKRIPGYYKGAVKHLGPYISAENSIYTSGSRPPGYSISESLYETFAKNINAIPYWKKPVVHNVYQPPESEVITPEYLPMIKANMPEMRSQEPEITPNFTFPKQSNVNNRISWRMDPETRKMVPVYLEGKQKVAQGKRLYNQNIPTSTMAIPEDFEPQFNRPESFEKTDPYWRRKYVQPKTVANKKYGGWLDNYE